jgi:hypothetical protein
LAHSQLKANHLESRKKGHFAYQVIFDDSRVGTVRQLGRQLLKLGQPIDWAILVISIFFNKTFLGLGERKSRLTEIAIHIITRERLA